MVALRVEMRKEHDAEVESLLWPEGERTAGGRCLRTAKLFFAASNQSEARDRRKTWPISEAGGEGWEPDLGGVDKERPYLGGDNALSIVDAAALASVSATLAHRRNIERRVDRAALEAAMSSRRPEYVRPLLRRLAAPPPLRRRPSTSCGLRRRRRRRRRRRWTTSSRCSIGLQRARPTRRRRRVRLRWRRRCAPRGSAAGCAPARVEWRVDSGAGADARRPPCRSGGGTAAVRERWRAAATRGCSCAPLGTTRAPPPCARRSAYARASSSRRRRRPRRRRARGPSRRRRRGSTSPAAGRTRRPSATSTAAW